MCLCPTKVDAQKFRIRLPLDHAAGDSRTRVPCGVGFIVVCICVNHNGRTTFVKERVRPIPEEGSVRIQKGRLSVSSAVYLDVQQVSGMRTFGIVFSVFLRSWVEMPSCAHEIRAFALANRMNVNSMGTGRQ